jgi:hypothetical protein
MIFLQILAGNKSRRLRDKWENVIFLMTENGTLQFFELKSIEKLILFGLN